MDIHGKLSTQHNKMSGENFRKSRLRSFLSTTKHAGLDKINPGSVILSGVMMLEFLGWYEAANLITKGIS